MRRVRSPNAPRRKMSPFDGAFKIERTLRTQTMVLESFEGAINLAVSQGIQYGQIIQSGNWQLIFGLPNQPGLFPSIIHAIYR